MVAKPSFLLGASLMSSDSLFTSPHFPSWLLTSPSADYQPSQCSEGTRSASGWWFPIRKLNRTIGEGGEREMANARLQKILPEPTEIEKSCTKPVHKW